MTEMTRVTDVDNGDIQIIEMFTGPPGKTVEFHVGENAPAYSLGVVGDVYIVVGSNADRGNVYRKVNANTWDLVGSLLGPAGGVSAVNGKTGDVVLTIDDIENLRSELSSSRTFTGATAPESGSEGDLWLAGDNVLHRHDGTEWVSVRDAGIAEALALATNAASRVATHIGPTAPTEKNANDLWLDTSVEGKNKVSYWTGSTWEDVSDSRIAEALTAANDALATAQAAEDTADQTADSLDAISATLNTRVRTFFQSTVPVAMAAGDLWINSADNNHLYRAVVAGANEIKAGEWVSARDGSIAAVAALADSANQAALNAMTEAQQAQALADGAIRTHYGASAPWANGTTQPNEHVGDMWFNSTTGRASRWDGTTWVLITDDRITQALSDAADAQAAADGKITAFYQDAEPTGADTGDLWYDTNDGNKPYYWTGSAWTTIQDQAISDAKTAALAAQATAVAADSKAEQAQTAADVALADAADAAAIADGKVSTHFDPDQPTGLTAADVGDLWFDTNDGYKMYRWDGSAWIISADTRISQAMSQANNAQVLANAKTTTFYQSTVPTSISVGDLWVNSDDDNSLYRAESIGANEIQSGEWVSVRDTSIAAAAASAAAAHLAAADALTAAQQAAAVADGNISTHYQASPPWPDGSFQDDDVLGDMWFNADTNQAYRWNGSMWVIIADNAVAQALAAAMSAQTTADGKINAYYASTAPVVNGEGAPLSVDDTGDLWFDLSSQNRPYYWDGAEWLSVRDASIADAANAAATANALASEALSEAERARSVADGSVRTYYSTGKPWSDNLYSGHAMASNAGWVGTTLVEGYVIITAGGVYSPFIPTTAPKTASMRVEFFNPTTEDIFSNWGVWSTGANGLFADGHAGAPSEVFVPAGGSAVWTGEVTLTGEEGGFRLRHVSGDAIGLQIRSVLAFTTDSEEFVDSYPASDASFADMWYDSDDNVPHRWNGMAWVEIQDAGIAAAMALANEAQSTADGKINAYYSATEPTVNDNGDALSVADEGDLWYDTGDQNRPHYWDGSNWQSIQDERVDDLAVKVDQSVKSYSVQYAVNTSETVAPTTGWSTATPTRSPGAFIWTRTLVTYQDNTTNTTNPALLTGNTGATGSQGIPGPAGADGTERYTWLKYADTPTTGMSDSPVGKTYMGIAYNQTSATESSNYSVYQWSLIKGADGTDGKGISTTTVNYAKSTDGVNAPTTGWSPTIPTTVAGEFLWTRTVTNYTDSSNSVAYSVARHGATGGAGRGVSGSTVSYQVHSNGTTAPTGTWLTTIPATSPGQFLWTRTVTTYTDNQNPTTAYAVAAHGVTGQQGIQGPPGANGQPTYTWIKYGTSAAGAGMSDDPTGKAYIGIAYNKTTQTESTVATDYVWSLIQGPTGSQGPAGPTGATGVSITSVTPYYAQVATGATAPAQPTTQATPPAPWQATEPDYVFNTELYRTDRIAYSNSTYAYTSRVKSSAYTAAVTAITAANGKNKIMFSGDNPSGTNYTDGDIWYKKSGSDIIAIWEFISGSWQPRTLRDEVLKSLSVGKLVSGSIDAAAITLTGNGVIQSANYDTSSTGFRLTASGINIKGIPLTISQVSGLGTALDSKATPAYVDGRANEAEVAAMEARTQSSNSTFDNWTSSFPAGCAGWGGTLPVKEQSLVRTGRYAVRYDNTTTNDTGMAVPSAITDLPPSEYYVIEADVMPISGNFSGAGVRLEWNGGSQPVHLNFHTTVPVPTLSRWYQFTQVVKRPTGGTGALTGVYIMANYSGLSPKTNKSIIFDRVGLRSASNAEIEAYEAQNNIHNSAVSVLNESREFVRSRGLNLVTNGTGYLNNNTNFPGSVYNGADTPSGITGSFVYGPGYRTAILDETIPVDPERVYEFSAYIRQVAGGTSSNASMMFVPMDAYKWSIQPQHYMYREGTTTTLTEALKPGDTVMKVASTANWNNAAGSQTHWRNVIFWDYVDPGGKAWPEHTYSRNIYGNMYPDGGITNATTVTLSAPYSGPTRPVGTKLSNGGAGGTYMYVASSVAVSDTWQRFSGRTEKGLHNVPLGSAVTKFPPGTAATKIGFLLNMPSPGTGIQQAVAGLSLVDVTDQVSVINTTTAIDTLNLNPYFSDWVPGSIAPANWEIPFAGVWPERETVDVRSAGVAAKWVVPANTSRYFNTNVVLPNSDFLNIETDVMLKEGNFLGSGFLVRWYNTVGGYADAYVRFSQEVANPVLNRWYRFSKTVPRPSNFTGTYAKTAIFTMAGFSTPAFDGATFPAKTIIFDNVRVTPGSDASRDSWRAENTLVGWRHPSDQTKIQGGNIFTGSVTAQQIASNAVQARHLYVGDFLNYADVDENVAGSVSYSGWASTSESGWAGRAPLTGNANEQYFMFNNEKAGAGVPFKTGDWVLIEFDAVATTPVAVDTRLWVYGNTNLNQSMNGVDGTVNITTTPTPFRRKAQVTIDMNGKTSWLVGIHGAGLTGSNNIKVRNVRVRRMHAGSMIVDGSIEAKHVVSDVFKGKEFIVDTGGSIRSKTFTSTQGWQLSETGLVIRGNATIDAAAIKTGQIDAARINTSVISIGPSQVTGLPSTLSTMAANTTAAFERWAPTGATTIHGDKLATGTVLAKHIAISDFSNLVTDPYFDKGRWTIQQHGSIADISQMPEGMGPGKSIKFSGALDTTEEAYSLDTFPVTENEPIRASVWVKKIGAGTAGGANMRIRFYNSAGQNFAPYYREANFPAASLTHNVWRELVYEGSVPTGAVSARMELLVVGISSTDDYYFALPRARKMNAGQLIVDGSIEAKHVASDAVTTRHLRVTDPADVFLDPHITDSIESWTVTGGTVSVGTSDYTGTANGRALVIPAGQTPTLKSRRFKVDPGAQYRVSSVAKGMGSMVSVTGYATETSTTAVGTTSTVSLGVSASWTTTTEQVFTAAANANWAEVNVLSLSGGVSIDQVHVRRMFGGELVVDGTIKTEHMAAGTIDAKVISAGTLSVQQLSVGNLDNILSDPRFIVESTNPNLGKYWSKHASGTVTATDGRGGTPAYKLNNNATAQSFYHLNGIKPAVGDAPYMEFDVDSGQQYKVSAWIRQTTAIPAGGVTIGVRWTSTSGALTYDWVSSKAKTAAEATVWHKVEGILPAAPADVKSMAVYVQSTSANSTGVLYIDFISMTRATNSQLVVDGSIQADHLAAGSVNAKSLNVTAGGNNLLDNSDATADAPLFPGIGTTVTRDTAFKMPGKLASFKMTVNTTSTYTGYGMRVLNNVDVANNTVGIRPNTTYTATQWVYMSDTAIVNVSLVASGDGQTRSPGFTSGPTITTKNQWIPVTCTFTTNATGTVTLSNWTTPTSLTVGKHYWVGQVILHEGDVPQAWAPKQQELLPGTITATMLTADAINGKIITGTQLRTAADGSRVEVGSTGSGGQVGDIRIYNANNNFAYIRAMTDHLFIAPPVLGHGAYLRIYNQSSASNKEAQTMRWDGIIASHAVSTNYLMGTGGPASSVVMASGLWVENTGVVTSLNSPVGMNNYVTIGSASLPNSVTSPGINATVYDGPSVNIHPTNNIVGRTGSSARYKTDIRPLTDLGGRSFLDLDPIMYKSKAMIEAYENGEASQKPQDIPGYLAEEVVKEFPELVFFDEEGRPDSLRYERMTAYLALEVRALRDQLEDEKIRNEELETRLERIERALENSADS